MSKDRFIAEAYYDERQGFGSIEHTLKRAREKDATITRGDVKEFLDKQEVKQQRKTNTGEQFCCRFASSGIPS
jgi:hypothetical protein